MKTIAVIFGGRSAEHDVSVITAHIPVIDSLTAAGNFDIWPVYITKEGKWYSDKAMNDLAFFKQPNYEEVLKNKKQLRLSFENGLELIWPGLRDKKVNIDVVFTAMHGTYGEDGSLMGLLRMANVPFVGSDMTASAVAMDKAFTKQVLEHEGVPVVPFVWFTRSDWNADNSLTIVNHNSQTVVGKKSILEKIAKLKYPLFVKPVHLGSSIGITKVKAPDGHRPALTELERAIEVALHYDDKVLVEEGVESLIEVTLPIIGNDELELASVERPLNKTELFDFNDKYLSGGKGSGVNTEYSEIPAQIGDELTKQVQELGKKTYKILGCAGIARVDFLIDAKTNKVFVNEVNLLPGSLYHHNWKKTGVSGVDLVTKLVRLAEERFAAEQKLTHTFSSDILNKVGGPKMQP